MTDFKLTADIERAYDALENGDRNVFITGKAGTGKSTFLNHFRKNTNKNVAVVAPTGVAALNVRGQTIHSFFGIKSGFVDTEHLKAARRKKVFQKIDVLVIDEISMVRADLFDAIEKVLRVNGPHRGAPFGGVQLCVIGDLFQLPPVVTNDEMTAFEHYYKSPFFFSANTFEAAEFELIKFDTIFRQKDDDFIKVLNKVRIGRNQEDILDYLNQRHVPIIDDGGAVTLTTTNRIADGINTKKLDGLNAARKFYQGTVEGQFDVSGARMPSPEMLELKIGAQVMFTKNDTSETRKWVNGSLGQVTGLTDRGIYVDIWENGEVQEVKVEKEKWVSVRYTFDPDEDKIIEEEVGSYQQYPLMLAWAVTIHKSQGKTLEKAIIDLGWGAFAPGQLYVALSRCKNFQKMTLKKPVKSTDIQCDPAVVDFIHNYKPPQRLF